MTGLADYGNIGYFPLQDHSYVDEERPLSTRLAMAGLRVSEHKSREESGEMTVVAAKDSKGTVGDVHPWMFWQTKDRGDRGTGSWAQSFAAVVTSSDPIYQKVDCRPIHTDLYDTDVRYEEYRALNAVGTQVPPKGSIVMVVPSTTEEEQMPLVMPVDARLIAPTQGGGAHGTLVADLDQQGEICMAEGVDPGADGRVARLQSILRVVPVGANGFGGLGQSDLNTIALNWTMSRGEGIANYGAAFMALDAPVATGPLTGGGSSGPITGPHGAGTASATAAGPAVTEGNTFGYTENGQGQSFGSGGVDFPGNEGRIINEWGTFTPNASGEAIALMAHGEGAFGPISAGSQGDKHSHGQDADGNPIHAAHISTRAFYFQDNQKDAPLEFSAVDYPENAGRFPLAAEVHLSYHANKLHAWKGSVLPGMWRWWTEVPIVEPTTGDPDPGTPFNPGNGGPTPPTGGRGGGRGGRTGRPGRGAPGRGGPTTGGPSGPANGGASSGGTTGGPTGGATGGPTGPGTGGPPKLGWDPWWDHPNRGRLDPHWAQVWHPPKPPEPAPPRPIPLGRPTTGGEKTMPSGGGMPPDSDGGGSDPGDPAGGGSTGTGPTTGRPGLCRRTNYAGLQQTAQAVGLHLPGDFTQNSRRIRPHTGLQTVNFSNPVNPGGPGGGIPRQTTAEAIAQANSTSPGYTPSQLLALGVNNGIQLEGQRGGPGGAGTYASRPYDQINREDEQRNPWTQQPSTTPGVVIAMGQEPGATNRYSLFHPMHEGFAAISFRPQLALAGAPHFERNPLLPASTYRRDEQTRPNVLNMRAFGHTNTSTGDFGYVQNPGSSVCRGGTSDGGVLMSPPRFELEDYFAIGSAEDVTDTTSAQATTSHMLHAPGVKSSFGLPTITGGLQTGGAQLGQISTQKPFGVSIQTAAGSTTDAITVNYDTGSSDIQVEMEGSGSLKLPSGTTAQRPTNLLSEGSIRWNSTNSSTEVYNGSTWQDVGATGDITTSGLTMTTQRLLGNTDAGGSTGSIQELTLDSDQFSLSNGTLQIGSIGTGEIDDSSITTGKLEDDAVTLDKAAFDIHESVLLTHVTNTGSTTSVTLQQGGESLGEDNVGIPLDRTCQTDSAVVTWRAGTAPAGTWTLTLKKKAAGSRSYTTAATMTVNVNNG